MFLPQSSNDIDLFRHFARYNPIIHAACRVCVCVFVSETRPNRYFCH